MTELECQAVYESGVRCGECACCTAMAAYHLREQAVIGNPSDLHAP
ncbi:hypothetical protein [Nonomuraea rubra]|uniref:Uncharacterized protein n=1 Tax=Nonomuraea rubra TaxID=46180 RepID=A0A7X0U648_9ACTN|nr:hypothetical protein [Nonomuraea rubra]MBB6556244.1 hypothetical protein [Nonomuraea rubra]